VLGPRAALRSGRLALGELRPAVAGKGTGRGSAGTGRVAAASHVTFRSGRPASLRCSQRRSPGKPTDGDNCGGYSGYGEDTAVDNVSSPRPRSRRSYSEDTRIGPGDNGGYARVHASYASGGGGASRVPRIAGDVTAGPAVATWRAGGPCAVRGKAPLVICSGAASRRGLPYGGSTRFYGGSTRRQGHLGRFTGLRLRCRDWRAAVGGCHCASLMIRRRAAAAAVRPCVRPGPGSPSSSFPQVTCLDRSGRPVLPPLFACGMRARPALAVLVWSGDGSPVWGCTTTSGDRVPPRTRILVRFPQNDQHLNTHARAAGPHGRPGSRPRRRLRSGRQR
jgi:hypothetical protein